MTTAYTSLLGLALPVTGELSGTWGDTVNTAITSLLDTAVAGTTSITTDADITLTTTTGASNQARQAIILWNPASGTTTRNITAPAQSKIYTVINASGGTQSIVIRGVGPTTGVTVLKGESALVAWNGSDFVKVSSIGGSLTLLDLTVTGNTILGDAAADTLTVNATSTFNAPVSFAGQVKLPSTGRSAAAALTPTNPAFLYGVASTYTDTASSGTLAPVASFYGLAQPTLSTSNVTTYTSAATLYIANAPTTGGSATITNPYALYVAAGTTYLAGSVGIGTSTVSYKLTLQETGGSTFNREYVLRNGDQTNFWRLSQGRNLAATTSGIPTNAAFIVTENGGGYGASAGLALGTIESAPLLSITAGVERMRITSGGAVGIGTNIPATFANALAVQGTTALVGNASFTSSSPTYQGILRLIENPTTIQSTGGLEFFTSTFGSGYGWKMTSLDSSGVQLTFATRQNSATWTEAMRISSTGAVTIGNTSDNNTRVLTFNTVSGGSSSIQSITDGATNQALTFSTTYTTLQERMRIDGQGNVGIGTSSPGGKLEASVGLLPSTSGSQVIIERLSGTTSNASYVDISLIRDSAGTSWTTAGTRFQQKIDSTYMGFMQFNGTNSGSGITFGTGTNASATGVPTALTIALDGNVLLGNANPTAAAGGRYLDIYNLENTSANSFAITRYITYDVGGTTTASADIFKYKNGGFYLNNNETNAAAFTALGVGASERMRIDSSGNVGIGISSPQQPLHVYSSAAAGKYIYAQQAGSYNIGFQAQNSVSNWYAYTAASTGNFEFFQGSGSGNVVVVSPVGLGYGTGSGGTVTQATSRTTGVTLNKPTGAITLVSAAGSPTWQEFTVTNSIVTANDTFVLNQRAGADRYVLQVRSISAGSFVIAFQTTGGTTTEQPIFNFAIIKGATS